MLNVIIVIKVFDIHKLTYYSNNQNQVTKHLNSICDIKTFTMFRHIRRVASSHHNAAQRCLILTRPLSSVSSNHRALQVKPEGTTPVRWRGVVPGLVTARIRQEVLITPVYRNRVVGVRKSWLGASESTSAILGRIKETTGSDVSWLSSLSQEEFIQVFIR